MSDTERVRVQDGSAPETNPEAGGPARSRSATLLNLKWLAERIQRAQRIKGELQAGHYVVNTVRLAKAILNRE